MENTSMLLWGLVFGSIGFGYFMYGKKQKHKVALASGIALMLLPYMIANQTMLILAGLVLLFIPRFMKI